MSLPSRARRRWRKSSTTISPHVPAPTTPSAPALSARAPAVSPDWIRDPSSTPFLGWFPGHGAGNASGAFAPGMLLSAPGRDQHEVRQHHAAITPGVLASGVDDRGANLVLDLLWVRGHHRGDRGRGPLDELPEVLRRAPFEGDLNLLHLGVRESAAVEQAAERFGRRPRQRAGAAGRRRRKLEPAHHDAERDSKEGDAVGRPPS